jgi:hypothetical protein
MERAVHPTPSRISISATDRRAVQRVALRHALDALAEASPRASTSTARRQPHDLGQKTAAADHRAGRRGSEARGRPERGDVYHRRGLLGCTRDATIICPDRGPGALETKCVFDYRTWMTDWEGGKRRPAARNPASAADASATARQPIQWGVIAAWVAGEVHYFERKPIVDLWERCTRPPTLLQDREDMREPDPFGVPIEVEWLTKMLPTTKGKVVDLSTDAQRRDAFAEAAAPTRRQGAGERRQAHRRAAARQAARARPRRRGGAAAGGIKVRIGGNEKSKRLNVYVPDDDHCRGKPAMPDDLLMAG